MSACTMNSATPRTIHRFFAVATSADFLKNICETPSMIEARMTSATPAIASVMGMAMVRAAADEPDPGEDKDDARDLENVDLLAEPRRREAEHRDVTQRGDGLRVAQDQHLEHAQPVEELGDEEDDDDRHHQRIDAGRGELPEELHDRVEHDREPEPEGERGGDG